MFAQTLFILALLPTSAVAIDYRPINIQVLRITPLNGEIKFESGIGEKFKPLGSKTGVFEVQSLHDYVARTKQGELRYPRALTKPIEFGMKVGGWCAGLLAAGFLVNSIHHLPVWIDNLGYVLVPPAGGAMFYSSTRTKDRDAQRRHGEVIQTALGGQIELSAADLDQYIDQLDKALKAFQVFVKRAPPESQIP